MSTSRLREVERDDDVRLACRGAPGSALKLGASMIVNSARRGRAAAAGSAMNRLRQNRLCQAYSVMTRTGRR